MNLHACLCLYFTDYFPKIKDVSPETVKTYKDAFKLFLKFSSRHLSKAVPDLRLEDITPALILSFLDYLEQQRKNSTRTRNARLVALKSFAKMLRLLYPEHREIIERYIKKYRPVPKPIYSNRLFINQRSEGFTRNGIYRVCRKYLSKALSAKQLENLNPAHSFRYSCAVHLLLLGKSLTDIKNHLGHENLKSTMVYLHLSVSRKREVQKKFIKYIQSAISEEPKIDELLNWENKKEILATNVRRDSPPASRGGFETRLYS